MVNILYYFIILFILNSSSAGSCQGSKKFSICVMKVCGFRGLYKICLISYKISYSLLNYIVSFYVRAAYSCILSSTEQK